MADDQAYYLDDDLDEQAITQEDCWAVISSFFEDKGLVRQQLDSFDEFIQNTMQELVDENSDMILQTSSQHTGAEGDLTVRDLSVDGISCRLRISSVARS
jgi:DNA-directed RNA polymerase II subunit RPB2